MPLIAMTKSDVLERPGTLVPSAPHFTARELACHHCGTLRIRSELLTALESLRTRLGRPLAIVSGYRCTTYNASLPGAAKDSQHCKGTAADLDPLDRHEKITGYHLFSGLGWDAKGPHAGLVRHVDVRHVLGGSATPRNPATWTYPLA